MSRLSESKGGKLKMSNHRQQNNCIQKCPSIHEPCDPVQSYQPQQRNGTCTPLRGKGSAHLEKHICWGGPLGKMAVWPEKDNQGERRDVQRAEPFLPPREGSRRTSAHPRRVCAATTAAGGRQRSAGGDQPQLDRRRAAHLNQQVIRITVPAR